MFYEITNSITFLLEKMSFRITGFYFLYCRKISRIIGRISNKHFVMSTGSYYCCYTERALHYV
jgi:hypothetical protein